MGCVRQVLDWTTAKFFMAEGERPDQEPNVKAVEPQKPPTKAHPSLAKLRRELTEEELTPTVGRLLLDEIERVERENEELKEYRERYHDADKQCAILREQTKAAKSGEVLYSFSLSVGALVIGLTPAFWAQGAAAVGCIVVGSLLILAGLISKAVKR